jgi:hypothetical protein
VDKWNKWDTEVQSSEFKVPGSDHLELFTFHCSLLGCCSGGQVGQMGQVGHQSSKFKVSSCIPKTVHCSHCSLFTLLNCLLLTAATDFLFSNCLLLTAANDILQLFTVHCSLFTLLNCLLPSAANDFLQLFTLLNRLCCFKGHWLKEREFLVIDILFNCSSLVGAKK